MKTAIQMDPIEGIDIAGDSTFAMALEAQARGSELFVYHPSDLAWRDGRITAVARKTTVRDEAGNHASLEPADEIDLRTMDVVLMRQDPPFDMSYISATHILEHLAPETLVVNDPVSVRNAPEKLLSTHFPGLMPDTLITSNAEAIRAFKHEHDDIILKPLYGNGGAGVFRTQPGDQNLNALLELFELTFREPIIAQAYLPEVRQGDKRVILVDGEPVGAINRVPAEGEARSNMHVGGRAEPADLTARDREICAAIGPTLKERGLIFVGIDVIGNWLTEINVTSPTGIREVKRFGGPDIAALIWDAIERKL